MQYLTAYFQKNISIIHAAFTIKTQLTCHAT